MFGRNPFGFEAIYLSSFIIIFIKMLRLLFGLILGVISGGVVDYLFFNNISSAIYLQPTNFDITNVQMTMDYFQKMPNPVRFINLLGVVFGAFTAGFVAAKIAFSDDPKTGPLAARIAGFAMLIFQAMVMALQASQPWWFHMIGLVVVIPMAILGGRLVKS
jgi:hypothetical protein